VMLGIFAAALIAGHLYIIFIITVIQLVSFNEVCCARLCVPDCDCEASVADGHAGTNRMIGHCDIKRTKSSPIITIYQELELVLSRYNNVLSVRGECSILL
jgi:hypothetical protein